MARQPKDQPGHVSPTTPAQPGERDQDELPPRDQGEQTEAVGESPQDVADELEEQRPE